MRIVPGYAIGKLSIIHRHEQRRLELHVELPPAVARIPFHRLGAARDDDTGQQDRNEISHRR